VPEAIRTLGMRKAEAAEIMLITGADS